MKIKSSAAVVAGLLSVAFLTTAAAAAPLAYPAKGQSAATQKKDEGECRTWAIQKSGYDPSRPPPPKAVAAGATGSGAGVRGAAVGATIGAVSGGNAGEAAGAGAVAGRVVKRSRNRQAANAQNAANAQQMAAGQGAFDQAQGACLAGRGYSVR